MTSAAGPRQPPGRPSSLKRRLVLVLVATTSIPVALAIALALWTYGTDRGAVDTVLALSADAAARQVETAIAAARLSEALLTDPAAPDARACRAGPPAAPGLALIDGSGTVVCAEALAVGTELGDRPWFRALRDGREVAVGGAVAGAVAGRASLVVAVASRGGADFAGATGIWLDLGAAGRDSDRVIGIVDDAGALARPYRGRAGPVPDGGAIRRLATMADGSAFDYTPPGGETLRLAAAPIGDTRLTLIYGGEAHALYAPHRLKLAAGIALPVLLGFTAAATAWLSVEAMVVRWLAFLRRLASAYARGRFSLRPVRLARAPAELRALGRALDEMLAAIASRDARLRDHVAYRDSLIREIHHRVKNNFQIIGSLVSLQSHAVRDPAAAAALVMLRGRIDALALVHRVLDESSNIEVVPLAPFYRSLAAQFEELIGPQAGIRLEVDVTPVDVSADRAVALAMLATEAIGNAYQHAFPGNRAGTIRLRLAAAGDDQLALRIEDDGVGLLAGQDAAASDTLGCALIHGFARQLGGRATIDVAAAGATVTVVFPRAFEAPAAPGGKR